MDRALTEFSRKVSSKKLNIAVVGLGYVGLPLAVEFAMKGFCVTGVEVDRDRLSHIRNKESYITDVATAKLRGALASGRFSATADFRLIGESDCVIICVPTPLKRKYHPDISYIRQAVKSISGNIKKGALVILESTTYPGTTDEVILGLFKARGLRHGEDFFLCFSPERIDPGNKTYPVNRIPKVIGGLNKQATEMASLVYKHIIERVVPVSSARVAEAVKLLENTFRLVNIALIDEIAMMAHRMGIDIWEVIEAAKTKPFGFMPFYPGAGCGGHCIPKDPLYLYWKARKYGFKSRFIKLASNLISDMPGYVVDRVLSLLGKRASGMRILVVGVTYKRDVKDLRKSPALDIIEVLKDKGIGVSYYDPLIPYLKFNNISLKRVGLTGKNLKTFDCAIIATDHSRVDYGLIAKHSRLVFDVHNVYKGGGGKIIRL